MTDRVLVTTPSKFFRADVPYPVLAWGENSDGDRCPKVRNDYGSFTWLVNLRTWRLADVPASA